MNFLFLLSLFFYCFSQTIISHNEFPHTDSIIKKIAEENGKTLCDSDENSDLHFNQAIRGDKKFYEILNITLQNHIHPLQDEKRRLVFDIFTMYEQCYNIKNSTVLDTTSWQDLEILCGPKEHLASYLAKKIDRTYTEMGRVNFYKKIVTPIASKEELLKIQTIVRELTENNTLFENICKEFEELQKTEGCLLSFWKEDIFKNLLKQNTFKIPYSKKLSTAANKNTALVEIAATGELIGRVGSGIMLTTGALILPVLGVARMIDHPITNKIENFDAEHGFSKALGFGSLTAFVLAKIASNYKNAYTESASNIIGAPMSGMNVLYLPDSLRGFITMKRSIQIKLMYLSRYINALQRLSHLAEENSVLSINFPELKNLNENITILKKNHQDIEQLLSILDTKTFKGEPDFFSWYGRMYVAYQLFSSKKDLFLPLIMTGAQLDVFISSSRLIREFKNHNVSFCFPEYLDSEFPSIEIQNFWNPAIDHHRAIPNSLTMGDYNLPHNVMVTGPNAGGKSTTMKGLVMNIILAQSLGIAPSEKMRFTPFNTIMTYMNIPDDIVSGKSHFRAEASRAYNLLKASQSSQKNHFTFIILDEVFNGTTFHEAQAATFALLESIIENPYTTCIAVTHLPHIPTAAEKSGKFGIYKVTSSITTEGLIHYSHKLQSGISKEPSIAFKILKQEGFDDKFLNKASNFLQTHKEKT